MANKYAKVNKYVGAETATEQVIKHFTIDGINEEIGRHEAEITKLEAIKTKLEDLGVVSKSGEE